MKPSLKHDFKFHKSFRSFEMAPKNSEFDFKQIFFNPFESQDGKRSRDPDLNYFDEINISSKKTT